MNAYLTVLEFVVFLSLQRTKMPLILCVVADQSANTYTDIYGIVRKTYTLNLPSFYSKSIFPDGMNRNTYNFF